jgi:hypothetical protein
MKRTIILVIFLAAFASCSNRNEKNIAGNWVVYKLLKDGIDWTNTSPYRDSIINYSITFDENGDFREYNFFPPDTDTVIIPGKWSFEDSYQKLVLEDTIYAKRTYFVFNLEGNHVELRRGGLNRYLRKKN